MSSWYFSAYKVRKLPAENSSKHNQNEQICFQQEHKQNTTMYLF